MQRIKPNRKHFLYGLSVSGLIVGIALATMLLCLYDSGRSMLGVRYWDKNISVYSVVPETGYESAAVEFFEKDINQIKKEFAPVKAVLPISNIKGSAKSYKASSSIEITATGERYPELYNTKIMKGRFISREDVENKRKVLLLDDVTAYKLFGRIDVVGRKVELHLGRTVDEFDIIGVFSNNNKNISNYFTRKLDGESYIPEATLREMQIEADASQLIIFADRSMKKDEFKKKAEHYFDKYALGEPEVEEIAQLQATEKFMDSYMPTLVVAAFLAYMLGCICFLNALLLSITERNKEIAMAKFFGASQKELKEEVLYKAELVALGSSLIGFALGYLVCFFIVKFLNMNVYFSFYAVAAALLLGVISGILAGSYAADSIKIVDEKSIVWQ